MEGKQVEEIKRHFDIVAKKIDRVSVKVENHEERIGKLGKRVTGRKESSHYSIQRRQISER